MASNDRRVEPLEREPEVLELNPWTLADLRDFAIRRAKGRCEWPDCTMAGEQMAHFKHRGMGGGKSRT